jgi:hypothetical protein
MKKRIVWFALLLSGVMALPVVGSTFPSAIQGNVKNLQANMTNIMAQIGSIATTNLIEQATTISNIAVRIQSLAAESLGEQSTINTTLESLLKDKNSRLGIARFKSIDPNVPQAMRDSYAGTLSGLEEQYNSLLDATFAIRRIGRELTTQGKCLSDLADAVAFGKECSIYCPDLGKTLNVSISKQLHGVQECMKEILSNISDN